MLLPMLNAKSDMLMTVIVILVANVYTNPLLLVSVGKSVVQS